jgi:unconventional prefoldin RPB5 interactor 1
MYLILTLPEIFELFGVGKGPIRHPIEVSRLVDRRLDYVQQNVSTISKQVEKIESQLSEVLEEMDREDDDTLEPGLPITEILEELDEDGNIISSKVTQPEQQTAQIVETLRKAGLKDIDPNLKNGDTTKNSTSEATEKPKAAPANQAQDTPKATLDAPKATKKGVSFAEEVQEREIPSRADNASASKSSGVNPSLFTGTFANGERVIELDDDDDIIGTQAVIPEDESPEDARLRREMLQYNLNEVGQVVAELDLDENLSEFEDDDDYLDDEYDSEISEEEDEHGRSIRPGISKSYRDQMRELEESLRSRVIGNLGPNLEEVDPVYDPEGLRRLVVRGEEGASNETLKPAISKGKEAVKSDGSTKKGVRFNEELDVQEAPKSEAPVASKPRTAPIADVVERAPSTAQAPSQPTKPAKVSRFKQNRAAAADETAQPESAPAQDSGSVMSDKIVEHPAAPATNVRAPEEVDELDPELQQRQLASEYYRLRNNIIRQQGGFKETEEEKDDPLMEQFPDGKMKKVSRFKAARMKF